ncbi:MAG: hypothetical protein ACOX28_00195 [Bacilli bacterium]|jgi:hypothetical protein
MSAGRTGIKILKIIIGIFLVSLLVIPIVLVLLVYDTRMNEPYREENVTIDHLANRVITDSLDNTKTKEEINLVINEDHMNQLLFQLLEDYGEGFNSYVPQIDMKINGESYVFYFNLRSSGFKTRAVLHTTLSIRDIDAEKAFYFRIDKIQIGHLKGLESLATWVAGKFVTNDDIESLLGERMNVKVNLENREIIYKVSDFISDLERNIIGDGGGELDKLYFTLVKDIYAKAKIDFSFEDSIHVYVLLSDFKTNPKYVGGGYELDLDLENIGGKVEQMLNDHLSEPFFATSTPEKADIDNMFAYLIRGYDQAHEDEKNFIDNFCGDDLSKLNKYGIADYKAYTGPYIPTSEKLEKVMEDNLVQIETLEELNAFKASEEPIITYLTEQELNDFLGSLNIVGSMYTTHAYYKDFTEAKFNYIVVDDFYANFINRDGDEYLDFIIGLNVNGLHTNFVFSTKNAEYVAEGTNQVGLKFITESVYYGEMFGSEALKTALFKTIQLALKDEANLVFNEIDNSINVTFTFDSVIEDAMALLGGTAEAEVSSPLTIADPNGRINIVWNE